MNRMSKVLEIITTFLEGDKPDESGVSGGGKSDDEDDEEEMEAPVIEAFFEA